MRAGTTDAALFRTRDAGRSWQELAATGLAAAGTPGQLIVSPRFGADSTVYLHTAKGLFAWSDPTTGFRPVDPLADGPVFTPVLSAYTDVALPDAVPEVGTGRVSLVQANQTKPARLSPPLRVPVAGAAPSFTERFLVPPWRGEATPLALATIPAKAPNGGRYEVRACTWEFACSTVLGLLPLGELHGAWLSPGYEQDHTVYVVIDTKSGIEVLRSTDSGKRFTALPGAARALAATNRALRAAHADPARPPGLAVDSGNPRRLALRVSLAGVVKSVPAEQVFTSADGGATWRRAGYAWGGDGTRGGTLPWWGAAMSSMWSEGTALWYVSGRLFALANSGHDHGGSGVYCSLDHGSTWHRGRCG